ncbi:MAG: hypothetical protein RL148_422 [Planctomycetota bacterium]|jgi:uncharacterized membrane protein YbaN (DUF454 family)
MPKKHPQPPLKRAIRNVSGVLLVLLGVVGLFVPVMQGVLFLVLGLALIDLPVKHRAHEALKARFRAYRWVAMRHHAIKRRLRRERGATAVAD